MRTAAVLLGVLALDAATAQNALPGRAEAPVATTRAFAFYSDSVFNLHDFLVWNARSQEPVEPAPACLASLPPGQREAFEHAREYYAKTFANGAGELVLLSMRWRLAKLGDIALAEPAQIAATVAELAPALAAYEACWWPEHDGRLAMAEAVKQLVEALPVESR